MKPSIGRIVIARGEAALGNSADEAPAMITRVWGQREDGAWTVNATVFPDGAISGAATRGVSSVGLYADEVAAKDAASLPGNTVLYWPPRV